MKNQHKSAPRVALVASIAWTIWNYRRSLIRDLETDGYEVILLAAEDHTRPQIEAITTAGFVPLQQLSRRSLSPFQNLKALLELFRTLRYHRPDIALFFTIRPNTLGNIAAAIAGIPSISIIEGMGISATTTPWLRWFTRKLYWFSLLHASKVIFLNQEDQREFIASGIVPAQKTQLIPGPGVDLEYFAPRPENQSNQPIVFLFVARLLSEKGIYEFVEAARIFRQKNLAAEFCVLGDTDTGNPTTISESEIIAWTQEGIIRHLGFLDDVRPAIAASDVLVLPSFYREGVPRSILEAMSMGKPIVTTDNVGCRDTVEHGENGLIVPPRNANALAEALEQMANLSVTERAEMGRKSREKVALEFGDQWVIPRYLALIEEVLKGKLDSGK